MSFMNKKQLSLLERLVAKVSLVDEELANEGRELYDEQQKKAVKRRKYYREYMALDRKMNEKYKLK